MHKQNMRNAQKRRRRRNRRIVRLAGLVLFFAVIVLVICLVISKCSQRSETGEQIYAGYQAEDPAGETVSEDDEITDEEEIPPVTEPPAAEKPWYLTLVNSENPLPEDYEAVLAEVPGGEEVDERIYEPLMEMLQAAKEANSGQIPEIVSGYRTMEKQQRLYDARIEEYMEQGYSEAEAVTQAEKWVAVPGYSENQLGFAVDINGETYDLYLWLQEHSYKYGFIFRYPGDKESITGISEEVWHYRYVGKEAAAEIYAQGLCLEEYLEKSENG